MPTEVVSSSPGSERPREVPDVASALAGGPTALVLDLSPVLGVNIAADLSARLLAHVVLVLPRWPHPEAVLPTRELMATLVESSRDVRSNVSTPSVVFVLDGERSCSIRRPRADPRVDNRYDLSVGDLPNLRQLRDAGIQRVVKVSRTCLMS